MAASTTPVVSVDIGGTHARFALAEIAADGAIALGDPTTLKTSDFASFQTAWQHFSSTCGDSLPRAVSFAVAGPVGGEIIRFTNNPWIIRPALVKEKLGVDTYTIVNDFGAVAHTVACAPDDRFMHLAGPDVPLPAKGTISVVGPGTGLGVAHLWRDEDGYRVQPTEGGHGDFAPLDQIEDAILVRLRSRHTRVSVERVVSGPAIVDIYQTLAALEGRAVTERGDRELWEAGVGGEDALAAAAVDRFCLSLGAVAGDYALAHGATGVVIAGGLGYRIRETLRNSTFADRFRAKGRFEQLMAQIPVKLITHPEPGLFGAAAAFARQHLG